MKKEYMKPEVNEIAVEANQAIAACAITSGFEVIWKGYNTTSVGGCEGSLFFDSPDGPAKYYGKVEGGLGWGNYEDYVNTTYGCYEVKVLGDHSFNFEDKNGNGKWDGEGPDHHQYVVSHGDIFPSLANS